MSWGIASGWKAREGTSLSLFFKGGGGGKMGNCCIKSLLKE